VRQEQLLVCIIAPFGRVATLEAPMMCEVCRRIVNLHQVKLRKRNEVVVLCADHVAVFRAACELVSAEPIVPTTPPSKARAGARDEAPPVTPVPLDGPCSWPGCEHAQRSSGFCARDYYRVRKLGLTPRGLSAAQLVELPALWEARVGCGGKHLAHGLCVRDYSRVHKLGIKPSEPEVYAELPARWSARNRPPPAVPTEPIASCAECPNEPICPKQVQVDACIAAGRLAPVATSPSQESTMPKPKKLLPELAAPAPKRLRMGSLQHPPAAPPSPSTPTDAPAVDPCSASSAAAEVARLEQLGVEKRVRLGICGMLHAALGAPEAPGDAEWDLAGLLAEVEILVAFQAQVREEQRIASLRRAELCRAVSADPHESLLDAVSMAVEQIADAHRELDVAGVQLTAATLAGRIEWLSRAKPAAVLDEKELLARIAAYEEYLRAPERVSASDQIIVVASPTQKAVKISPSRSILDVINLTFDQRRTTLLQRALRGEPEPEPEPEAARGMAS